MEIKEDDQQLNVERKESAKEQNQHDWKGKTESAKESQLWLNSEDQQLRKTRSFTVFGFVEFGKKKKIFGQREKKGFQPNYQASQDHHVQQNAIHAMNTVLQPSQNSFHMQQAQNSGL
ncbi:hypothetical protein IMY05_017G0011800 [Salix suchowensis]|nr:hypothetical protein IMY05_017G0011800 [Salix suchowensis]